MNIKNFLIFIATVLLTISLLKSQENPINAPLSKVEGDTTFFTGNIQISGRQLLVNGVPFVMKGVCYSPVRQGATYPDGLMTLNPTPDDLAVIERDFQMMEQAGINTIRTYLPLTNPAVLALLTKYHLRTIVPICPSLQYYQNLDVIERNVEILKNEPSTLIWEIGNEWNLNHFYTYNINAIGQSQGASNLSEQQCLDLIQTVANLVRKHDGAHPVSSDISTPAVERIISGRNKNGNSRSNSIYQVIPDCVDLIGVNVYHRLNLGPGFNRWNELTNKPFYLGEMGAVAWNTNINAEDDASQAFGDRSLLMKMMRHLSATNSSNVLVGGCIFEWCDEWWCEGLPSEHDALGVTIQGGGGPYPTGCFSNKWFGILDIDHHPRDAYFAIKAIFNPTAQ